jgi:hypothetical protein
MSYLLILFIMANSSKLAIETSKKIGSEKSQVIMKEDMMLNEEKGKIERKTGVSYIPIKGGRYLLGSKGWMPILQEDFESGIPANWTVISGDGDVYTWSAGTYAWLAPPDSGTAYCYYDDDAAGSGAISGDTIMSPILAVPSVADTLSLTYGYGHQIYQGESLKVLVRYHDGMSWGAWAQLTAYVTDITGTGQFYLDNTQDSLQVMWVYRDDHTSSSWGYGSAFDNVVIEYFMSIANDAGMYAINSPITDNLIGKTVDVNGTVKNYGTNTYSFDVTANVYDPALGLVFTNTQSINNLAPNDTLNVDFGNLQLSMLGQYTVEMFTYEAGDNNPTNDTLFTTFNVEREIWASLPNAPGRRLAHATVYDPDDDLFFIIGGDSTGANITNSCFEFNPSTEVWASRTPMSTARDWIEGAYRNGYIHVMGGYDGATGLTSHEVYDIALNSWSTAAPIPYPAGRIAHGLVTWNDSLVYLIGGRDIGTGYSQRTVDFYEPVSNTWISADSMPIGFDMGGAKIDGNTIYIIGGLEAFSGYIFEMVLKGEINPSNPTQINWQWTDSLPDINFNNGLAIKNGKAYMIGGFLGNVVSDAVYIYDLSSGVWEEITPYPFLIARNHIAERRDKPDSLGIVYSFMGDVGAAWNPTDQCFKLMRSEAVATDTLYGNVDAFDTTYDQGSIVTAISGSYVYIDTTDSDGNYLISNIYDGVYDVIASRSGYADSVVSGVIITGNLQLDFGLYPYAVLYEEDFEADSGNYAPTVDWQWGTPTTGPTNAHSGINLWATMLDTNYSVNSNSQLVTVPINITGVNAPILSFYHWFDTESYYDGCNVKISVNGGPWQLLDALDPPYNEDAASTSNAGIPGEPCYSGHDQGYWEEVKRDMSDYIDSTVTLMFHFGSDGSVQYPGWYIDDVSVYYKDTTAGITTDDDTPMMYSLKTPGITTSDQFSIIYSLPKKSKVSIGVYDCTGREINNLEYIKEAGWYQERFDMNGRPSGIYFVKIKAGEFTQTKKTVLLR